MESCSNESPNIHNKEEFSVLPFFNSNFNDIAHEFLSDYETLLLPRTELEWGYLLCFAIKVEQIIRNIFFNEECFGCLITSLSQQAHTCLMNFQKVLQQSFGQVMDEIPSEEVEECFRNFCEFEKWNIPDNGKNDELMLNCRTIWRNIIYESIVNNFKEYPETWKYIIKICL
ncbi:MAG: hypothetical protein MJA29_00595 [Candidatus Omnitrophica bacterium]|nr:hypothetical protein [Candidatus Omnitrophota bacterium]